jgi:hypothetical protein
MSFFESFAGHYLAQAAVYSLVAIIVIEAVLFLWRIEEPLTHIKFRLLALGLPLIGPLLFDAAYPARNGFLFREQVALIDISTWLGLRLGDVVAVWQIFAALLAVTTIVFLFREAVPAVRHLLSRPDPLPAIAEGRFPRLDAAMKGLPEKASIPRPALLLSPEKTPVAYSGGCSVVISGPVLDLLDDDELRAVMAHEIAHVSRKVTWTNRLLLVLRWLQFYNPLALIVFQSAVNDSERLCDDLAAEYSGKPLSLTSGLLKMFRRASPGTGKPGRSRAPMRGLESVANRNMVKERIRRFLDPADPGPVTYPDLRLGVTAVFLAALLFFIV